MDAVARNRLAPAVALVLALVLVSCGSDGSDGATASDTPDRPDVTGISMTDVATGDEVLLSDALDAPASTPVLAVFWAPH